jgi:hypothetical protein
MGTLHLPQEESTDLRFYRIAPHSPNHPDE